EALVILEAVRRANDRVVQPVRMVVVEHLANALLEVRRRDDYAVRSRRQTVRRLLTIRRLHDYRIGVQMVGIEAVAWQHDLRLPAGTELRHHAADRLVAPLVAAGR